VEQKDDADEDRRQPAEVLAVVGLGHEAAKTEDGRTTGQSRQTSGRDEVRLVASTTSPTAMNISPGAICEPRVARITAPSDEGGHGDRTREEEPQQAGRQNARNDPRDSTTTIQIWCDS
jgi:hypothetical protein